MTSSGDYPCAGTAPPASIEDRINYARYRQVTVSELPLVPDEVVESARTGTASTEAHARYLRDMPVFHLIESVPPRYVAPWPARLTLASFNAERLKDVGAVRALMDSVCPHVTLLTEVDLGMARSGNTHTLHELTGEAGEGYLFGVEFLELDLGDEIEMREHAGERNALGLHGNAIVSDLRFERPHLIPLEESGFWFPGQNGAQRRMGGRIALAARLVNLPFPLWVVTVHLESKTNPEDRQRQIQAMLRGLDTIAAGEACIIGGDLNTKELPPNDWDLTEAERFEPLFGDLRREGFTWRPPICPSPLSAPVHPESRSRRFENSIAILCAASRLTAQG